MTLFVWLMTRDVFVNAQKYLRQASRKPRVKVHYRKSQIMAFDNSIIDAMSIQLGNAESRNANIWEPE